MMNKATYGAEAIAEDLKNLGDEIANDTDRTLAETNPRDFNFDEWAKMREALETMRKTLDEIEEMIDNAENDALEYDEDTAEDRYECWWE